MVMLFSKHMRYAKCAFLVTAICTAVILIQFNLRSQVIDQITIEKFFEPDSDTYDVYMMQMLSPKFLECIAHPSKVSCQPDPKNETHAPLLCNTVNDHATYPLSVAAKERHPIHKAFDDFTSLFNQYDIQMILIEPSILFCMLSQEHQLLLLRRGLNLTNLLGSGNVLTFGVVGEMAAAKLEELELMKRIQSAGFHYHSAKTKVTFKSGNNLEEQMVIHAFYKRQHVVIHVVVFWERAKYYWHSEISTLPQDISDIAPLKKILFAQTEAIYERITAVRVQASSTVHYLYLPLDPQLFLHEIPTSTFLECNISHSYYVRKAKYEGHPSGMSEENFNANTVIAMQELKAQLRSFLITFWIFSGTLLGWYRECGVISYTHDVDFSAWAEDIDDDKELIKVLKTNKYLIIEQRMGLKREGLELRFYVHGLMVDLFFTYKTDKHYWTAGHRPSKGYYFPYIFPKFTLCSADLLGHKVHVPCDSRATLIAEYGKDWDKPISSWAYDQSPKNMGENHYWNDSEKDEAFSML